MFISHGKRPLEEYKQHTVTLDNSVALQCLMDVQWRYNVERTIRHVNHSCTTASNICPSQQEDYSQK